VAEEESENIRADCTPCADSYLILKEQISRLDNMVLEEGKKSESNKADH
jgi:hypothetical protein